MSCVAAPRGAAGAVGGARLFHHSTRANRVDSRAQYNFGCLSVLIAQDERQVNEAGALVQIQQSFAEFVALDIRTGF